MLHVRVSGSEIIQIGSGVPHVGAVGQMHICS